MLREFSEKIVLKIEDFQSKKLCDFRLDVGNFVIGKVELFERTDGKDISWNEAEFPARKVEVFLI